LNAAFAHNFAILANRYAAWLLQAQKQSPHRCAKKRRKIKATQGKAPNFATGLFPVR